MKLIHIFHGQNALSLSLMNKIYYVHLHYRPIPTLLRERNAQDVLQLPKTKLLCEKYNNAKT